AFQGGGVPGSILTNCFADAFSSGLTIGTDDGAGPNHSAKWTSDSTGISALKTYLTSAAGGPNGKLTADTLNATSTSGGSLPRQTAALALNVGFNDASCMICPDSTSPNSFGFGDLTAANFVDGSNNLHTGGTITVPAGQAGALN